MDTSKDVLTDNYAYLVKHMKAEDVLPKLVSARLVGQQMNQKIENQTDAKKVQTLLDELGRSPDPEWFVKFTDALSDTDENHKMIAKKLQAGIAYVEPRLHTICNNVSMVADYSFHFPLYSFSVHRI